MTAPVPVPSAKRFLSIIKEGTKGTPAAATTLFPVETFDWTPQQMLLPDTALRGSAVDQYNLVAGVAHSEFSFGGAVFIDTIGYPLAGVLGEVASSGSPVAHQMTVLNSGTMQPPSYTLNPYYVAANRQIAGSQFDEVIFTWAADGLFKYTAKGKGLPANTASAPTASVGTLTPRAGWQCAVSIAGSSTTILLDGTVSIKRNVTPIFTSAASQSPTNLWGGVVSVDGTVRLIMESDTELTRYLTPATAVLDLFWSPDGTQGLHLVMSKTQYTAGKPEFGKDWVELPITFKALGNTTNVGASGGFGPVTATLTNAIVSGTYA